MKRFTIIIVLLTLVLLVVIAADNSRPHSFAISAVSVNVGDSKERVVEILGPATHVFKPPPTIPTGFYLGVRTETWAYGKRLDLQNCFHSGFPYFWPVKMRLFGPHADDVEVEFDSTGRVSRVSMPTK